MLLAALTAWRCRGRAIDVDIPGGIAHIGGTMLTKLFIGIAGLSWIGLLAAAGADNQGVQITQLADRVRVELNGDLFTEYFFKDVPRPYCYPILGPGGLQIGDHYGIKIGP